MLGRGAIRINFQNVARIGLASWNLLLRGYTVLGDEINKYLFVIIIFDFNIETGGLLLVSAKRKNDRQIDVSDKKA